MVSRIDHGSEVIWFDESLVVEPGDKIFDIEFWRANDAVIGSAQGRGTTWFVQTSTLPAALRHYRRGGLFGKLVKDTYRFSSWEQTRSYAEFMLLKLLASAGVNVPRPLAARAQKNGFGYRADLLSEKIPNAKDLVAILKQAPLSKEQYQNIGEQIAKMHHAKVNHTDLNIHNLLLDDNGKVWIIDFDKCYQQQGNDWQQSNLDRLLRSFHKELKKCAIQWREDDFKELLSGYHQASTTLGS